MYENITKKEWKCECEVKWESVSVCEVMQKVKKGKIEIDGVKWIWINKKYRYVIKKGIKKWVLFCDLDT